eukprot:SAG11_NODE_358_length_10235_cov_5.689917_4_plen_67_part_00
MSNLRLCRSGHSTVYQPVTDLWGVLPMMCGVLTMLCPLAHKSDTALIWGQDLVGISAQQDWQEHSD